jgi:hypothetical protein
MRTRLNQLALALTLAALTCAPAAGFAANPAATPQQTPPNAVGQEKHPVMRKAIAQLQRTREELQNDASRDFDGHRANAVKLIDQAIQQLQLGIQSDKH